MQYFSGHGVIVLIVFALLFGSIHGNNWEQCPGEWIRYNDEKCFKIIDDNLRTFDEAKDSCSTDENISTLAVIRSNEEQEFLSNYLFKTKQKLDNFWIGAKYSSQNDSFTWIDNSPLNYTNWDAGSPRSLSNHCVHLQADVSVVGKWKDGRCGKKNAVVCQRMQFWSHELLQKTFLDLRKQQRDTIRNLTESLASANQKIANLENVDQRINELKLNFENGILDANQRINRQKQSLESANARINEQKQSLESANARINEQKQSLESANARINEQKQSLESANARISEQKKSLDNVNTRFNEQKVTLENANLRILEQKQSLDNANARINELKQNLIPIGFLYTQLPNEKTPSEIWPWMTWTDASPAYAGVFFRVEGGGAATFGQVQNENSPRLTEVYNQVSWENSQAISTPVGGWSPYVVSGWVSDREFLRLKFLQSGGEVRPRNMAIRVWRRTG